MSTTVTTSKRYSLNGRDLLRGALVAAISAVISQALVMLNEGEFVFKWKVLVASGLSAGLGYLAKNYFSPATIEVTPVDEKTVQDVKDGDKEVTIKPT